jgi:hypothetical protein
MDEIIEPAPVEGIALYVPEQNEWVPILLDAYGFPATEERKEELRRYQNWVWSDEVGEWVPPTPQPDPVMNADSPEWVDAVYVWDDEAVAWVQVPTQPYPSWTRDPDGVWQPPVPYPTMDGLWMWDEDTLSWVEVSEV